MKFKTIPANPEGYGVLTSRLNVVYREIDGEQLTCDIIFHRDFKTEKHPAVVFVQGSGWKVNKRYTQLPNLSVLARKGFVVMTVTHRNTMEGHPFPAFLTDVKCAIKYLKANSEEFGVDPERIGIWGTSSGGHTALMAGMTGDTGIYRTPEFKGISSEVKCVVDFFGPTDIAMQSMFSAPQHGLTTKHAFPFLACMIGRDKCSEEEHEFTSAEKSALRRMSPLRIIDAKKNYPPMIVFHGTADEVVPIEMSDRFVERMQAYGKDVEYVKIEGAPHEGGCWSKKTYKLVYRFLAKHLK